MAYKKLKDLLGEKGSLPEVEELVLSSPCSILLVAFINCTLFAREMEGGFCGFSSCSKIGCLALDSRYTRI